MKIDIRPRQAGKTQQLLQLAAIDPANTLILCPSHRAADDLYRRARETFPDIEWDRLRFLSASSTTTLIQTRGSHLRNARTSILIDRADDVLESLFGPITAINLTAPDPDPAPTPTPRAPSTISSATWPKTPLRPWVAPSTPPTTSRFFLSHPTTAPHEPRK